MAKKKQSYKLNTEFAAEILSRKKIRPDAPGTQPGDPGNGHVLVVDAERQKFNGNIYTRRVMNHGRTVRYNYNINGVTYHLHVEVWKFHNGEPPKGYLVHHDCLLSNGKFNQEENNIEYLFLMPRAEHSFYHVLLSPGIPRICKNPNCRKPFIATNARIMYCCDDCADEVRELERHTVNRFVTPELERILEEAMAIASDAEIHTGSLENNGKMEIRICYYCHRPFKTSANKPAIMCARPDCKGRSLVHSISRVQNAVLDKIEERQNSLRTFFNKKFGKLDTIMIDGEPWFIGKQVATMLGYKNTADAIGKHVLPGDKKLLNWSQLQTSQIAMFSSRRGLMVINEFGVHDLIIDSELPEAKEIRYWITHEVMPSLRRKGYYSFLDHPPMNTDYISDQELQALLTFREVHGGDLGALYDFNKLTVEEQKVLLHMFDVLRNRHHHAEPPTIDVESQQN